MDVKQLRKLLKGIDGKKVVIMAKDAEGNNFCPLREIDSIVSFCCGEVNKLVLRETTRINRGAKY